MRSTHLRLLAAFLILAGLGLVGLAARKTVNLVVDGDSRPLPTFALTVGQFLRANRIPLGPGDRLQPPADCWLKDGQTVQIDRAAQVLVRADGQTRGLLTLERIPANLLAQAAVPLYPGDQLLAEGTVISPEDPLEPAQARSLSVQRAMTILLNEITPEGKHIHPLTSAAATLGQALWEAGIRLYAADRLSPGPETRLAVLEPGKAFEASLVRSQELSIRVGGRRLLARSAAATVGEALVEAGLSLQGLDECSPAENSPLPADGKIRITRVLESVIIEQTPLLFKTDYQAAPDLEIDQQSVLKTGEYGLIAHRVRVRYEDGNEVSRAVEGEWTARQPQNRVVGYGTKIVMHTLNTPGGPIQYWRALRFWATSYSPASAGGDTTASGKKLRKGMVGVDRSLIPFGTRMYVPGYGMAEAADTGAISGRWIDLGYSNDDYVAWHDWVTVYFLWPPPANPAWVFP